MSDVQAAARAKRLSQFQQVVSDRGGIDAPFAWTYGSHRPLHLAAYYGFVDGIHWLVKDAGVDMDSRTADDKNETALMIAAHENQNQAQCVSLLLRFAPDIDALDRSSHNALHWAESKRNRSCCQALHSAATVKALRSKFECLYASCVAAAEDIARAEHQKDLLRCGAQGAETSCAFTARAVVSQECVLTLVTFSFS